MAPTSAPTINSITFYKSAPDPMCEEQQRITEQLHQAGFSGNLHVHHLGYDTEDSISLIVEGRHNNEWCLWALGYGMNRSNLAFRKKFYRHAPGRGRSEP